MYSDQQHRKTLSLSRKPRHEYPASRKSGASRPLKHESDLKRMQEAGVDVSIRLASGNTVIGKIISVDKYTIKIDMKLSSGGATPRTFFKHGIESFAELK